MYICNRFHILTPATHNDVDVDVNGDVNGDENGDENENENENTP